MRFEVTRTVTRSPRSQCFQAYLRVVRNLRIVPPDPCHVTLAIGFVKSKERNSRSSTDIARVLSTPSCWSCRSWDSRSSSRYYNGSNQNELHLRLSDEIYIETVLYVCFKRHVLPHPEQGNTRVRSRRNSNL